MKIYKEKHLQATLYKIENTKREQNFLLKNKWKVLLFGIGFSLWAPLYQPQSRFSQRNSLASESEFSYVQLLVTCAIVYVVLCLLYHFVSEYQHKKRLQELTSLKNKLEQEIKEWD